MIKVVKCPICGKEIVALRNVYYRLRNHVKKYHNKELVERASLPSAII